MDPKSKRFSTLQSLSRKQIFLKKKFAQFGIVTFQSFKDDLFMLSIQFLTTSCSCEYVSG